MDMDILIIGLSGNRALIDALSSAHNRLIFCNSIFRAKQIIRKQRLDFFVIGTDFGAENVSLFLDWVMLECTLCGVVIERKINNKLCVKAINSQVVFDYMTQNETKERYEQIFISFIKRKPECFESYRLSV